MKDFNDLSWSMHSSAGYLNRAVMHFPNGYGVSVITGSNAYSSDNYPYELGVITSNGKLTYTTGITDDVLGYLTEEAVTAIMYEVQQLSQENNNA
tara:strand:- start:37 stop:321 length:285 start_codon:yes stop_codon:yes gene_type:complete